MSGERIGLYPGTFDPVTLGHLDIVKRAVKLLTVPNYAAMYFPRRGYGAIPYRVVKARRRDAHVLRGFGAT